MKKTDFLKMVFAAFALTVIMTACSTDDDDYLPVEEIKAPTEKGQKTSQSTNGHDNCCAMAEDNRITMDCMRGMDMPGRALF